MKKRIISLLLVLTFILPMIPTLGITALAISNVVSSQSEAVITVEEVWGNPGKTADLDLILTENPGILGATITISWDESLTLIGDASGDAFGHMTYTPPSRYVASGTNFVWFGNEVDETVDGTILTLTFQISENAQNNDILPVRVTYTPGDIFDENDNDVVLSITDGNIRAIDYLPGDVTGDDRVNPRDLVRMSQYISDGCKTDPEGYNAEVVADACDVTGDGRVNARDLTKLSQYISDGSQTNPDGYNAILKPAKMPACEHSNAQETPAKIAKCTEPGNIAYWYCYDCGKYFSDYECTAEISFDSTIIESTGHNNIPFDAVLATPTTEGYTAGVWCDICETWLFGHEVIPPISPNESNILYRHYVQRTEGGVTSFVPDAYLDTHEIINPNPTKYTEGTGVAELIEGVIIDDKKVSANGYTFIGWYEKPEVTANRVYSISADSTGDKTLYGVWTKNAYKITYHQDASSTLPKVEEGSYTIDSGAALNSPPAWPNLVWIGWSNEDGQIIESIPKGTTGDIELTANWMSRRNQTVPNTKYSTTTPAIVVNEDDGVYAFIYEIGEIQNVPIQQVEDGVDGKGFNLLKGQTHTIDKTFTQKIDKSEATSIADIIANATTKSDSWTLSEDWNKSTSFSEEHSNEISEEQSSKASQSFSTTGKYSLGSGTGGSEEHIDENGTSSKTASKHEFGVSLNAGIKADIKNLVTAATPFENVSVEGNLGLDYKYTKETAEETYEVHTDKTSSYWNVNESFELSQSMSQSSEFAHSLSQSIRDTYNYGETLDFGGSNSNTVSSSNTSSESREYASSVTYSTEEGSSITVSETLTGDADTGFYRKVLAADFKVFAVVIYDMKSNTFGTMTYSLKKNDSEHLFTDYSTLNSFNDYENGVLPFEVPTFVGDYVYGLVGASEGLRFDDETGVIEGYGYKDPDTGICYKEYDEITNTYSNPCDTDVIIPRYVVITVSGNNKKIVPVTGISASAFRGTNVTSVYLSDRITTIPDGAFENCTSLKYVRGGNINSIGKDAFKNCTSLFEFELPYFLVCLGSNAFEGVTALTVNVSNNSVFDSALISGVKRLSLNLENLDDSIDGKKIVTPANIEYFYIGGSGRTFNNVSIESIADTVVLNNININSSNGVPLKLSSSNVELEFTTINSNDFILKLDKDATVRLDGNNYFISSSENAILCKNIHFVEKAGSSAAGKLRVTGNILVYGTVIGAQRVTFTSNEYNFVTLTQSEYENILNSYYVQFDPNGGTVSQIKKSVVYGSAYGQLPIPEKEGYTFAGWYTDLGGGIVVEFDTIVFNTAEHTLYAKWEAKAYTVEWVESEHSRIDVLRISSPYANSETGVISSGDTVYFGDVLSVVYSVEEGYMLSDNGETDITVAGNVTAQDIYATAMLSDCTYNIVYVSSNGTILGTSMATYEYGTINTITPEIFEGYDTPEAQDVAWDSTSEKTITFTYIPTGVGVQTLKNISDEWWWKDYSVQYNQYFGIKYGVKVEFSNRTESSVTAKITWTNKIIDAYYPYAQYFNMTIGETSTGRMTIAEASKWSGTTIYNGSAVVTATITITGLSATTTELPYSVVPSAQLWDGKDEAEHPNDFSGTLVIPAY